MTKIRNEHQVRVDRRPVLTRIQKNARAIRRVPGELQQHLTARRNKAIAEATQAISQNEGRIKTLAGHIAKMEHDLGERIPRLKKLAKNIDGAAVRFRLYSLAEDQEIVLCSTDRSTDGKLEPPPPNRSLGDLLE